MSILAVITARGGSKRIPRKNIRDFCGRPIISYSIEAALNSGLFDEVMVSTDDGEIADVSRAMGAEVPFLRSAENSDDYATTADVLIEVLDKYEELGRTFDCVCCIYPTAPFVTAQKLRSANAMYENGAEAVLSVVRFSFPPQRGLVLNGETLQYWQPENENARSQDLMPIFHDAGQFYFRSVEGLRATRSLIAGCAAAFEVLGTEVQDIDNETDWELAEIKYERMISRDGKAAR